MPPLWRKKEKKGFMGNGDEEVEVKNDPRRSEGECLLPFSTFSPFFMPESFLLSCHCWFGARRGERGGGRRVCFFSSSHGAANHLHMLEMCGKQEEDGRRRGKES